MRRIRAVIFDLDDTLFDCTGQLAQTARKRAARVIAGAAKKTSTVQVLNLMEELYARSLSTPEVLKRLCQQLDIPRADTCAGAALTAYNSGTVGKVRLFPDAVPLLKELKERGIYRVLITSGIQGRQMEKVRKLNLDAWMNLILVHDIETGGEYKIDHFREALRRLSLKPGEVLNVGDRIRQEIRSGNQLGITSVRLLHGNYRNLKPRDYMETPDFEIPRLRDLLDVIGEIERGRHMHPNIVAIGGGTGLPSVLSALKHYSRNLTGIVTVTDSGRSSGVLRKELKILPPGDLRNCLIALSDSERLMQDLFLYRFDSGGLEGHNFGNLFLAALIKVTGSFEQAVREASRILAVRGRVLPSTLQDTHVCCELDDGTVIEEEFNVRKPGKRPIRRVFLRDSVAPHEETLEAIRDANLIVIGPGSLYTSILPNLLVKGIPEAIRNSRAPRVYVANMMTQPGQTDGMTLSQHVAELERYLGAGVLHYVLFNNSRPAPRVLRQYAAEKARMVTLDVENLPRTVTPVARDLRERSSRQVCWHKQYLLRHDSTRLRQALIEILEKYR